MINCFANPSTDDLIFHLASCPSITIRQVDKKHWTLHYVKVCAEERGEILVSCYSEAGGPHHYCKGRIATHYCTFERKKQDGEWMAWHEDRHFAALKSLTDEVDFLTRQYY